jgi:carboxymethylenebutenolidase
LLAAAAGTSGAAAQMVGVTVAEKDVVVNTPDGSCDAVLFHPDKKGSWPAVLVWPDIMGLRPAFRDMGRQLANQGYTVLVPNPFYRSKHAPVIEGKIDFSDPAQRQILVGFRQAMTDDGIVRDAQAYLAFLDTQPQTNKAHKAGVQGYCMGGELSFRTAAAMPGRIGAVGSFHGGNGLVTDKSNSPHLLIPKTDATFLVCQAQNDDAQKPGIKDALKAAFAAAHRPATVEVYPANHGWCVPGSQVYDEIQAQRAWAALTKLYRSTLA